MKCKKILITLVSTSLITPLTNIIAMKNNVNSDFKNNIYNNEYISNNFINDSYEKSAKEVINQSSNMIQKIIDDFEKYLKQKDLGNKNEAINPKKIENDIDRLCEIINKTSSVINSLEPKKGNVDELTQQIGVLSQTAVNFRHIKDDFSTLKSVEKTIRNRKIENMKIEELKPLQDRIDYNLYKTRTHIKRIDKSGINDNKDKAVEYFNVKLSNQYFKTVKILNKLKELLGNYSMSIGKEILSTHIKKPAKAALKDNTLPNLKEILHTYATPTKDTHDKNFSKKKTDKIDIKMQVHLIEKLNKEEMNKKIEDLYENRDRINLQALFKIQEILKEYAKGNLFNRSCDVNSKINNNKNKQTQENIKLFFKANGLSDLLKYTYHRRNLEIIFKDIEKIISNIRKIEDNSTRNDLIAKYETKIKEIDKIDMEVTKNNTESLEKQIEKYIKRKEMKNHFYIEEIIKEIGKIKEIRKKINLKNMELSKIMNNKYTN